MPTFWVENKNFSQNFVFAFEKLVFYCLNPDPEKNPGSGSVKKRIRIQNTGHKTRQNPLVQALTSVHDPF